MSIYDYKLINMKGEEVSLKSFEGKVLLIVNTATGCGFTPHYEDLERLYETYHDRGLEIIDIPCNQFLGQAPGSDKEIHQFCQLKYNTSYEQYTKSDVNGEKELPLYTYLKSQQGFKGFQGPQAQVMDDLLAGIDPDYKNNPAIKWNFTKFIVDRKGAVVARFEPTDGMDAVEDCVKSLL